MSDNTEKPIEKPWAVYGLLVKFIGKVIREDRFNAYLQYYEKQQFPLKSWNFHYIQRFDNPLEAIDYLLNRNFEYSRKNLLKIS